jgi:hypothetical protein
VVVVVVMFVLACPLGIASLVVSPITPSRRCGGGVSCLEKWVVVVVSGQAAGAFCVLTLQVPRYPGTSLGSLNPEQPREGGGGRASCIVVIAEPKNILVQKRR